MSHVYHYSYYLLHKNLSKKGGCPQLHGQYSRLWDTHAFDSKVIVLSVTSHYLNYFACLWGTIGKQHHAVECTDV